MKIPKHEVKAGDPNVVTKLLTEVTEKSSFESLQARHSLSTLNALGSLISQTTPVYFMKLEEPSGNFSEP